MPDTPTPVPQRQPRLVDLVSSRDGSMSVTKVAATLAHLLMAAAFVRHQVLGDAPFNELVWLVYGGFAITHAMYDKTRAQWVDRQNRRDAAATTPTPEA
ncbi:MAG: hypothetical protein IIZ92_07290 [Aquincola sp.]|nr:hypothetical protein [Aquincola sp.]